MSSPTTSDARGAGATCFGAQPTATKLKATEAAEQEPGHATHADPPEERQSDRPEDAQLDPLLREPGRHRIDQLAIEEQHLEHRDGDFDQNHEDDVAGLPRLDGVIQHLDTS